ncbi:heterokaryon incompatibility protein-domain-containing protein [Podospora didyma]|uniref:Heterokaryon incompatibility protein-domain-containing protein n=1 Tax=Podospora didyma TaxID=330526 RepID=A0AAE0NRM0_9PEZI|nr:heterokaryon incompatibility protein-domain-containing protein [Podospora didyma]
MQVSRLNVRLSYTKEYVLQLRGWSLLSMTWRITPLATFLLGCQTSCRPRLRDTSAFHPSLCDKLSTKTRHEFEVDKPFHYVTLPSPTGWIRLLKIEPSPRDSAPIACLLEDHKVAKGPQDYEALSYVWGNDPAECSVSINSRRFLVRKSLFGALLALRHATDWRTVWVDAICINQGDMEERNSQVRQMKSIYSQARLVNVWLGPATFGSDRGMDLLQIISSRLDKARQRRGGKEPTAETVTTKSEAMGLKMKTRKMFSAYYKPIMPLFQGDPDAIADLNEAVDLLRRPWWTRMWTLQESVLGREVALLCGTKSISLSCIHHLSYFIFFSVAYQRWPGGPIDPAVAVRAAWQTADLRGHIEDRGQIPLLLAVDASWNRMSSDPRDKIIGLLGLADPSSTARGHLNRAGYDWPVEKVFYTAFRAVAKEERSLSFLGLLSEQPRLRNSNLPSWVPDLEVHSGLGSDFISSLSKPSFISPLYNASLQAHPPITFADSNRTLVVSGTRIGSVTSLGMNALGPQILSDEKSPGRASWTDQMNSILQSWQDLMMTEQAGQETYQHTGEPSRQAFWRCVFADLKQGPVHNHVSFGRPVRMDHHDHRFLPTLHTNEEYRQMLLEWWASFCATGSRHLRLIEQFHRRFFVTNSGYIGLGPPWLEAGDIICILLGGPVAYALRKNFNGPGEQWTYIGESYVHGVMDGEIVKRIRPGTYQKFHIV